MFFRNVRNQLPSDALSQIHQWYATFHVIKEKKTQIYLSQKPTYKLHVRCHIHPRLIVSKDFLNRKVHAGKKPTSDHLSQSKIYTDINKKIFPHCIMQSTKEITETMDIRDSS
jgi:hypothetical protein